jgi:hypothetical protein
MCKADAFTLSLSIQELLTAVRCEHLGMEVKNNRRQLKCLRKLVRAQHRDAEHSNK